ncbi:MAG: iron-containing alcohol dehydrogenase [Candidatus Heimdallarchaeota archaeon]
MSGSWESITAYDPLREMFTFEVNKIIFGISAYEKLASEILNLGGKTPVIVTDKGISDTGIVNRVKESVEKTGITVEIFDKVATEPTAESMQEAIDMIRESKSDIIVGLGGGSSMDTAKIGAVMKENEGDLLDYIGKKPFTNPRMPLILVPTTAGTGSEVTAIAVTSVGDKKRGIFDSKLFADIALVDPLLTLSMPPKVTASTGLDALSHAIESMMTLRSNILCDTLALQAVKLVSENLEKVFMQGKNLPARYGMMLAATTAGITLQNALVTLPHSVGYTIAHEHHLPHGIATVVALPYAMRFNLSLCQEKFRDVASVMGCNIEGLSLREAAIEGIKAVKKLIKDVNMPVSLKEIGVSKDHLTDLVDEFLAEYPRPFNICKVNRENLLKLYEDMWEGRIQ